MLMLLMRDFQSCKMFRLADLSTLIVPSWCSLLRRPLNSNVAFAPQKCVSDAPFRRAKGDYFCASSSTSVGLLFSVELADGVIAGVD
jgi:hypothetical protein